jgi:saccharopine dehydrogenase-like NADP-dependent oxidoreductase
MTAKIVVLGCGLVGGLIAEDLSHDFNVTVVDTRKDTLERLASRIGVKAIFGSALNLHVLSAAVREADLVCGALPGKIGYSVLGRLIKMGKNVCDISFMPEDGHELSNAARRQGVTAIVDAGVAPGLSHLLVGRATSMLEMTQKVRIYVGGLPQKPSPPLNYRIVFSAEDVLEEYTRPARYLKDGQLHVADPLSGIERIDIPEIGPLEAFFTDGLRSLIQNVQADDVWEKTLRYPGHADQMRFLKALGFFSQTPRQFDGKWLSPRKILLDILRPHWQMRPDKGDKDITIMRVTVQGKFDCEKRTYQWDFIDRFDDDSGTHSMARSTGFPCAVMARAMLCGLVNEKGVLTPEMLASNEETYRFIMKELEARGLRIKETVTV